MKIFAALFITAVAITSIGCKNMISVSVGKGPSIAGSGNVVKEDRTVDPFSKIDFQGGGTLTIRQGEEQSVSVSVDDNLLKVIETTVADGQLTIKPNNDISDFKLDIEVVVVKLDELKLSGVGTMNLKSIDAEALMVKISGATKINGEGKAKSLSINSSGACSLDLEDLVAQTVTIESSGASKSTVHATEKLDAKVSGVGKVTCYGSPKTVDKSVKGVGKITVVD